MTEKTLSEMNPVEIITAVRKKDLSVIQALTKHLVRTKKMTPTEIYEVITDYGVHLDRSAINKWLTRK